MRKTKCVRGLAMLLALVTVLGAFVALPAGTAVSSAAGLSASELAGILNAEAYDTYAERYEKLLEIQCDENNSAAMSMGEIPIDLFDGVFEDKNGKEHEIAEEKGEVDRIAAGSAFRPEAGKVYVLEDLDGSKALFTPDSGSVTWTFKVPQLNLAADGKDDLGYLYMLKIEYYPINIDENVATVERSLSLGTPGSKEASIPFAEARALSFTKNWVYGYANEETGAFIKTYKPLNAESPKSFSGPEVPFKYDKDKGGNDIRYTAVQDPKWMTYYAQDVDGFHHGSFYFFFEASPTLAKDGTKAPDMEHTITISGSRENLAIRSISLVPAQFDKEVSYQDYLAKYAGAKDEAGTPDADGKLGKITMIEAEFPTNVSDTSVYPSNDRSSAITSPSLPQSQLMNTIGAESYNTVGQWASYKFTVSKDGWYNMTMRYRQNLLDGLFVSRSVKLWSSDGEYGLADGTPTAPFREAHLTRFNYSKSWEVENLGAVINGEKNDFRFYFKAGVEYVVRFEVSLGDLAEIIKEVEDSLAAINECYLAVMKLTGASPDQYRDYGFNEIMPETIGAMRAQSRALYDVVDRFVALAGTKGSQVATLEQIAFLLDKMGSKESEVAKNLTNLKSHIGTLGTWLNNVKQQGLLVDYVNIQPLAAEQPRENANFFESIGFEISAFFVSFFVDYNSMGVKAEAEVGEDAGIDVWLAYGRDQALIWRSLIDSEFTPKEQIPVRLKLVVGGTLLPSVLSGRGPDVYIGLASGDVINYAIRNAIEPIDGEEGYVQTYGYDVTLTDTVENSYKRLYYVDPSRYDVTGIDYDEANPVPYKYVNEEGETVESTKYRVSDSEIAFNYANTIPISLLGKTYGVPETTNFPMLFYRMDVLAELDVDIPRTWDDLLAATTKFQANNMQMGLTYASALTTFIYQKGGSQWMYEDASSYKDPSLFDPAYAGAEIGLGSDIALDAFRYCARLYTDYSFPVAFDAANRFRTGEMPLVITDYCTMYNQLTVFATEIRGLWSFASLPGFEQYEKDENGDDKLLYTDVDGDGKYDPEVDEATVNNCAVATLTATVLLKKKGEKNNYADAWKYMKWQAHESAQASYGNQMVALIGPAAKYATANSQAIRNLSWTSTELDAILSQFENLAAVPNFPGSYIISRYVEFAFLAAANNGADPVDELNGYITTINKELTRKRKEFKEFNLGTMEDFKDGKIPPWEIEPGTQSGS